MLTDIIPKLPMRDKAVTRSYYVNELGFLTQKKITGIYIRTDNVDEFYQTLLNNRVEIHPNGHLEDKPWQQREFSLLDPDNNLLTFGQSKN